jgi:DNA polymerase-3 subunit delta
MTALKAHQVEGFLKKPDLKAGVFLVYGPDNGKVHETALHLVHHYAGNPPDSMAYTVLEGAELDAEPERLAVEARTSSLFGGQRTLRIRNAGKSVAASLKEILSDLPDSVIIVETGNLTPRDALRILAESDPNARALPCYADDEESLSALIRGTFQSAGISIDQDVTPTLRRLLGNNREITRRELEKLCLFAAGSKSLTSEDVYLLCGDNSAPALDAVVDAMGSGHPAELDTALKALGGSGTDANRLLAVALNHITWLRRIRADIDKGKSARDALSSARPRPHFSRTRTLERQLRQWNDTALASAGQRIYTAIADVRKNASIAPSIAERALFGICMLAAQR